MRVRLDELRLDQVQYDDVPYRRSPLRRGRIDEFNYSAILLGVIYVKNIDTSFMYMIQYKHAKLLRQCVLVWPRNRLSIGNE